MRKNRYYNFWALVIMGMLLIAGCSTQKNTSGSRWWHSFNARYNTYYNGSLAYIDGSLEKEQSNKDNFTEIIPLYTVSNKESKELGKSNFERAIEKCEKAIHQHSIKRRPVWDKSRKKTEKETEWLNRKEYNPFLWKAWLLMGRSQFHKGDFEDAASTFAYMSRLYSTQPAIYGKARAWLAKCYIEQDWLYDAEDVIRNMQRDSIHWKAQKEWDYTYADYYLHTGEFEKAIPYLRKVIGYEMRRKQKAREWYLMGQIQAALGHKEEAYKAFKHVIRLNPPYELEFNARISMTEVLSSTKTKQMINTLKRMARSDNNKDYLDQIYYALGNIYLAQRDTTAAIAAYEQGNKKATRSGIEKGVLLLHLGDIYWEKEKYSDAKRCYGEAIGLLDKDRKDYEQLSNRSKVLDELVPYTDAVHLQDSLQELSKMPERDRNLAIDRVIKALKEKEKEQRKQDAEDNLSQNQGEDFSQTIKKPQSPMNSMENNGIWYFYNPMAVSRGKAQFQKLWGKRENIDNWQKNNKTVVSHSAGAEEMTDAMRDSLAHAAAKEDSLAQINESAQNDPHKREYYLAQIPFTEEQLQESNKILEDGLFHSGVIFKDKLDNLSLSEKSLKRLVDSYSDYEHIDEAYYHLYLLYMRKNQTDLAESYIDKLKKDFPKSEWTTLLTDPYFTENAKFGVHIEDSIYAATYEAFKAGNYEVVSTNSKLSRDRFPMGANRDKFLFIGGLSKLNNGDANGCLEDMKIVVEKYPESRISELAGMIINGVNAGKQLHGGKFDLENVWDQRSEALTDSADLAKMQFSNERNVNFRFMIVYKPDSVDENKLLFNLARFNFTTYLVRNFDINIDEQNGLHRMFIAGFRNFDEALEYARIFHQQTSVTQLLGKSRTYVISEPNLELLGSRFSYNDYEKFYTQHFAPLKVSTYRLLTEPEEISIEKEKDPTPEDIDNSFENTPFDNGFEMNPLTPEKKSESNKNVMDIPAESPVKPSTQQDAFEIPAEKEAKKKDNVDETTTVISAEKSIEKKDEGFIIPSQKETSTNKKKEEDGFIIPSEKKTSTNKKAEEDGFIIPSGKETTIQKNNDKPSTETTTLEIPKEETKKKAEEGISIAIPAENKPVEKKTTESRKAEQKNSNKQPEKKESIDGNGFTIDYSSTEKTATTKNTTSKTATTPNAAAGKAANNKVSGKTTQSKATSKSAPKTPVKQEPKKETKKENTGIYFDQGFGSENNKNVKKENKKPLQPKSFDLEDEYYDLEGF